MSILSVWKEEFSKFADFDYRLAVLSGSGTKKTDTLRHMRGIPLQVAIVNYESAWRIEESILDWKPDLIIADEGHKLKTHNIAASKFMHRAGVKASYRLLLTGTVITNTALDVFSQYKFLNPAIFGNSFYVFRSRYFNMTGYRNHTPVLKRSMEHDLMRRLYTIAFRATKAECLDLPETTDIIRYVELESTAANIYRDLVRDSYTKLGGSERSAPIAITAANILTKLLRLSQLTGGFFVDDEARSPQKISHVKLDALADIVEGATHEGNKLVVIARFVPEIKAISALLNKQDIKHALIMGGVIDREEQVARFQNDPEVMVFVGQIQTASLGFTLTAASNLVFYSTDYSMSNYEQARARIHRAGQTRHCTYYHIIARGTVDEKVMRSLRDKTDLARMLVDDYRKGQNPYL